LRIENWLRAEEADVEMSLDILFRDLGILFCDLDILFRDLDILFPRPRPCL
jgi:hypothetical protein